MVIGLTLAAIPTTTGVAEGVNAESKEDDHTNPSGIEAERMRKFNLECYCESTSRKAKEVHGGKVVLHGDKVYIDSQSSLKGHTLEGFYIEYPDPNRRRPLPLGLVSSINSDPPTLNWIYVDRHTREVKYGNRTQSKGHVVGSWGWDAGDEDGPGGLTLDGKEGAVAVETEDGREVRWEDGHGKSGPERKRQLTVSLDRKMLVAAGDEEQAVPDEMIRTESNFTLTKSTFKSSKRTTDESKKAVKAVVERAKPKAKSQNLRLEVR